MGRKQRYTTPVPTTRTLAQSGKLPCAQPCSSPVHQAATCCLGPRASWLASPSLSPIVYELTGTKLFTQWAIVSSGGRSTFSGTFFSDLHHLALSFTLIRKAVPETPGPGSVAPRRSCLKEPVFHPVGRGGSLGLNRSSASAGPQQL